MKLQEDYLYHCDVFIVADSSDNGNALVLLNKQCNDTHLWALWFWSHV